MMSLENADSDRRILIGGSPRRHRMDSLVVCIPDPWQRTQDRDGDRKVCKYAHNQHHDVIGGVIDEDQDHFENQPHETRDCASRVDPPKML